MREGDEEALVMLVDLGRNAECGRWIIGLRDSERMKKGRTERQQNTAIHNTTERRSWDMCAVRCVSVCGKRERERERERFLVTSIFF
jgi:hypothetical protein